jgi:hypothetical protein
MILDAAKIALGSFGFDRSVYRNLRKKNKGSNNRKWCHWWFQELKEERMKDIRTEMS